MRTNVAVAGPVTRTHEGTPAVRLTPIKSLRRAVHSALLWEDAFYETGSAIADNIATLVPKCKAADVAALAVEARDKMYLRHVPLFLVRELARGAGNGTLVAETLAHVIQRPDELTEYLALYWRGQADADKEPLSAGSKRGLALAFGKFKAETLAKYDRDAAVKLRDVLRLTHAAPKDADQAATWKHVVKRTLVAPDTWEVALSGGADKRETWERLLREGKLGGLAFIRNLRNMLAADVDHGLIRERFAGTFDKVLPFRFIAAMRHAPAFATELDSAMRRACAELPRLSGRTIVLVDVSGSMDATFSAKSEVTRMDAAAGLAVLARELGECRVFTFSQQLVEAPAWRGMALVDGILRSQPHGGTYLGQAVTTLHQHVRYDRLIVITDEQSHDAVPSPLGLGYVINVAPYKQGVCYGPWTHIDGWSEHVLRYIAAVELESAA